jgi:PAS domain S-box-containing protein
MAAADIYMLGSSFDEAQGHLAAIVTSSDDAIISKDLNGIIKSWNSAAERIFGFSSEEMIGRSILTVIPPERHAEESEILQKLKRGERIEHFQTVRLRKDGRPIDVSLTVSPVKDSTGKVIGASKIARDITEITRANHERERLYELGKLMAGELDVHALVQTTTNVATELSGAQFGAFYYELKDDRGDPYTLYTLSGVPRERFDKLPMPRQIDLFGADFRTAGVVRSDDATKDPRFARKGSRFGLLRAGLPVRSYLAVPVASRRGDLLGGLFFGHPEVGIFTRRSVELVASIAWHASVALDNARLHREQGLIAARFQLLANSIPQLAWMARPDGWIYWYNQRWYEYTGTSPDQTTGWKWESVHDPKELPRVIEKWKAALAEGTQWEDTFPIRRHDGVFRWHLSRAVPLRNAEDRITSWLGTNTDITDQMNLAREREHLLSAERAARSDAERVSRMKDEFLATLSHELRTPLNAILGWSQIIKSASHDPVTLEEGITVIERNARVQTQLIADLLDMSRIVSGKIRLDVQRVDLAAVIDAAIDSVKPAADSKGLSLRRVLDPLAGQVTGDPNRLQQVVWNLLSNAIKFTPKGGRIEVVLERVNSHAEIAVTDTGQGIKPEFLPYLFERFRQEDSTTTRHSGGLGLGLAIVKNLVELHGGHISARSSGEGQGASFCVVLPLAITKREPSSGEHPTAQRDSISFDCRTVTLEGLRVLVVDDELDARNLLKRLLTECKAEVILADSADQGMSKLQHDHPNVLISDIGMPQKDGYALLREVRALPVEQGGRTPAIALTAFARSEDRTRAMMAGYQSHISKPVEPQELIATVASLAGRTGTRS